MSASISIKEFRSELEKLIIEDDLEVVFEKLSDALESRASDERAYKLRDLVITRRSAYTRLAQDQSRGVLTREDFEVKHNEIVNTLLRIIRKDLPDVLDPPPPSIPLPDRQRLEKIIGYNNLLEISWLERGVDVARSVCRISFKNKKPQGTGFLVGTNLLMTNNHVIDSPEQADRMLAEFNYQTDTNGEPLPVARYQFDSQIFFTNPQLDYTVIGLRAPEGDVPPLPYWGVLKLNPNADPIPDEHVVIVQHPGGAPKQIALTSNQVIQAWEYRLFYTTDTMPGSSGSPVFNQKWEVIALHHAGGDQQVNEQGDRRFVNEGILLSWIKKDLGNRWPGA